MDVTFIAIEIGGTKLQLYAGRGCGEILERQRCAVVRDAGGEGIRKQISAVLPGLIDRWKPKAIGTGYGGPVDWKDGTIVKSHQIAGWEGFPLGAWLSEIAGLPAFVENDANTAALGEAIHGAGRGRDPVFYITLGSGVGGGLVVDGSIYHGAAPGEVEIGHVRLSPDGAIVEEVCSGWAVDKRVRRAVEEWPESKLASLVAASERGGEARHLSAAVAAGDDAARTVLTEIVEALAFALSHVVNLLHPEIIVLGGGLSLMGEPLRAGLAAAIPRFAMEPFRRGLLVSLATLREDSVPIGALSLAARRSAAA